MVISFPDDTDKYLHKNYPKKYIHHLYNLSWLPYKQIHVLKFQGDDYVICSAYKYRLTRKLHKDPHRVRVDTISSYAKSRKTIQTYTTCLNSYCKDSININDRYCNDCVEKVQLWRKLTLF